MLKNLDFIIQLQEIDKSIFLIQKKIQNIPNIIKEKENQLNLEKENLENIKKILSSKQVEKKDLELELSKIESNIEKFNLELNSVKTNDKYKAIIDIIKSEKQKKSELEDKILSDFDDIDQIDINIKEYKIKFQNLEKEFLNEKLDLEKSKIEMDSEILNLKNKRQDLINIIDNKYFIDMYDRIRENQNGIGIVPVDMERSSCTSCNMKIPIQKINEILNLSDPVCCENCSKILYVPKEK